MDTEFVLCELCMVDLRLECAGRVDSCSGIVNLEPRMRLTRQLSPQCVNRIKYQYYQQLDVHMHDLKFCVYMMLSRGQAKAGSQHAVLYPYTSRKVALPPAQIPLTRPTRSINGDANILNGLEGNMDSSHATARPS